MKRIKTRVDTTARPHTATIIFLIINASSENEISFRVCFLVCLFGLDEYPLSPSLLHMGIRTCVCLVLSVTIIILAAFKDWRWRIMFTQSLQSLSNFVFMLELIAFPHEYTPIRAMIA